MAADHRHGGQTAGVPDLGCGRPTVIALRAGPVRSPAKRTRLMAAEPDRALHGARRGHAQSVLGQWEEAVRDYTRALERGIESVRFARGEAFAELKRWKEAAEDFERAGAAGEDGFPWARENAW